MLVVHWAKQNRTNDILANGIRVSSRKLRPGFSDYQTNARGVYVYPYTRNKVQRGVWRRQLKRWDNILGNYNGFVFRLKESDCPLLVGYWWANREEPEQWTVHSLSELHEKWGAVFSGHAIDAGYEWEDFEIVIPEHISRKRIIKILEDRTPKGREV